MSERILRGHTGLKRPIAPFLSPSSPAISNWVVSSSIQYSVYTQIEVDLVQKFIKEYTLISNGGKNIVLCWIPSHTGIIGNEKADTTAKAALSLAVTPMKLPASEFFPRVKSLSQKIGNNCGKTVLKINCGLSDLLLEHIYAIQLSAVAT